MQVKKGRGAGMIPFPEKIEVFLEKVVPLLQPSLSIKTRLGLLSTSEVLKLIPVFNKYPISEIVIHARTAEQMYDGVANLDAFENCLDLLKIPVVYNGDIDSVQTFNSLKERFPSVNRWMIGRGILHNPFLAQQIKTGKIVDESERIKRLYDFQNAMFNEYSQVLSGPGHLVDKMKNLWMYLSANFENSGKIRKSIKRIQSKEQYLRIIEELFELELN